MITALQAAAKPLRVSPNPSEFRQTLPVLVLDTMKLIGRHVPAETGTVERMPAYQDA
jgi:hypothetical protein